MVIKNLVILAALFLSDDDLLKQLKRTLLNFQLMNKSLRICLLLLIGVMCVFAGNQYVLYGNFGLMLIHYILVALLCYYLPVALFDQEDYRMISYVVSVMLSFIVFTLLYLNIGNEIGFTARLGWLEVMLYDSTAFMLIGFLGAMFNAKYVK